MESQPVNDTAISSICWMIARDRWVGIYKAAARQPRAGREEEEDV
jgi:hypothetical protein